VVDSWISGLLSEEPTIVRALKLRSSEETLAQFVYPFQISMTALFSYVISDWNRSNLANSAGGMPDMPLKPSRGYVF
jgi:hypothetical protein